EPHLAEVEHVLHHDRVAFHALDLGDVHDPAGAVLEAALMDDEINSGGDLLAYRAQWQVDASHKDHRFESGEHVAGRVGMAGGHRAVVTGVHGLKHVQCFSATDLANDDPVWPHPEGVAHEL